MRKKYLPVLVAAVCILNTSTFAQDLELEFSDLFKRCRASIEANSAFDSDGLQAAEVAERHERDWGTNTEQEGWVSPGSEFYVVLTEWISDNGSSRRLCAIYLRDEDRDLTKSEQGLLLRQFLVTKNQLIGAGSHQIDRRLAPIPPLLNAGFLLSDRNPRGCRVAHSMVISPDGQFFYAVSGEQAIYDCKSG